MATRKMTFTLPAPLAERLQRQVPASQRSRVVAQAVANALDNQQRRLEAACLAANRDLDVAAISEEFDAIAHEATLPDWTAPRRNLVGTSRPRARRRD